MGSLRPIRLLAVLLCAAASAVPVLAESPSEYNAIGVEFYQAERWPEAIASFERAYEGAGPNDTVRRNLSNAYQAYASNLATANRVSDAIKQLELAIGVNPENARPLIQLGSYYLHEGLVSDAIFRLEEAIEVEPKNVDAHFLLGEAYNRDNDVTSALDQWEWVYQVDPDHAGLTERLDRGIREEKVEYDFKGLTSVHFNITYSPETKGKDVRQVLQHLESAYRIIGRSLGDGYPPTPIQVSLYSAEGFSETTQMGEHIGALYDGNKIRVPVFRADGQTIADDELKRRLFHEYVHVVVRHLAKDKVPWWLNEGLAETLSGELTDTQMEYLQRSRESNILFSLEELEIGQLDRLAVHSLQLAYRQSHAAVAFLKQRFGVRKLGTFLRLLGEGEETEEALRSSFRYTYRTLDLALGSFIGKG